MPTRRHVLGTALAAAAAAPFSGIARAAGDWRGQYPEIVYAVIPQENASGTTDRYGPFMAYLTQALGVKATQPLANHKPPNKQGHPPRKKHLPK